MSISLFTDNSKQIVVKIYCAIHKEHGNVICDPDKAQLADLYKGSIDVDAIEEQSMTFRYPTYGDMNKIMDSGVKMNEESNFVVSPVQLRYERLCTLASAWSLKDGEKDIPLNRENIKKLDPVIAAHFAMGLEKALRDKGLTLD